MRRTTTLVGVVILMTGCLAAPAPGDEDDGPGDEDGVPQPEDDGGDGDVGGDPGPAILPTCDTVLDLAYVSHVEAPAATADEESVVFDGFAVFVNPGEETLDLSSATATFRAVDTGGATAAIDIDRSAVGLAVGEARGLLPAPVQQLVFDQIADVVYTPSEVPRVGLELHHTQDDGSFAAEFDVRAGDLVFPVRVTVDVVDAVSSQGRIGTWAAVAGDRIRGICAAIPE